MNASNINSCHSLTEFLQPANLTIPTQSYLYSVYRRNSLLVSCHPRSTIRIFFITNHQPLSHMHHLTCGISFLLHSVNRILFTVLLVHLILRISPHHSHHFRSHHLSLPLPFTPDLKLISFTISSIVTLIPSRLTSWILTCTKLKGHCFVCFIFWLRVQMRVATLNSSIVSYRIVRYDTTR